MERNGRIVALLVNTGTPDEPTPRAVRRYLASYLADTRVVEMRRAIWYPILYGMVLPFRPARSAKKYRSIWTSEGSPLVVNARRIASALSGRFAGRGLPVEVDFAMCYGTPNLSRRVEELVREGVEKILVLPLFPQYSPQTVGAVMDGVGKACARVRNQPALRTVKRFWNHPGWAEAVAASVRKSWEKAGPVEGPASKLVFSYHGVPEECVVDWGDTYRDECLASSEAIASALGLPRESWETCFQSRFGPHEWLKPYSSVRAAELARAGVRRIDVLSPSFSCDCLETLEELDIELRETFLKAAPGGAFNYIPCINDSAEAVDFYEGLILGETQNWN